MSRLALLFLASSLAACAIQPATSADVDPVEDAELPVATLQVRGRVVSMGEPLAGAYVIALNDQGKTVGRTQTGADGRYTLGSAGRPATIAVKAYRRVPRFYPAPALVAVTATSFKFDTDVGPDLLADGNGENLTYLVTRSDDDPQLVPQVAWGNGGAVGSPNEELADLTVGARLPQLTSLLPRGTKVHPNVGAAVIDNGTFLTVRFNEPLNSYSLGAAYTSLLIDQIVATASINHGSKHLPVRIEVRCTTCPSGYAPMNDGHVGPTGPSESYKLGVTAPDALFSDVAGNRYVDHIAMARGLGLASGYTDGTFRPNRAITRAELATMLVSALRLSVPAPSKPSYRDVPATASYYRAVEALRARGVMAGRSDGTFAPNDSVTRGELASFIVNAARWPVVSPASPSFPDVPKTYWAYAKVETAYGWCHTVEERSFMPKIVFAPAATATRAEATAAVTRMMNCLTGTEVR